MSLSRNIPDQRAIIPSWTREHCIREKRVFCSHCAAQAWQRYKRVVVRVMHDRRSRGPRSSLEVLKYCEQCL